MIGVGIVGAGVAFQMHAQAYESLASRVRMVGLAELDEDRRLAATDQHFIPFACAQYRDLLARDDIDLIDVCTSPRSHEEIAIAALEAGKYVVCEKPLAHTLESADRMVEAASRFPGKLSTVYQLRYLPEIQQMIQLRDTGALGKLLFGTCTRFAGHQGSRGSKTGWWGQWDQAGGGVVMTQFIHHLDQLYYLLGLPVEVTASIDTLQEDIESEDSFTATIRFENGALVSCCATICAQQFQFRIDLFASQASVHYPWDLKCDDSARRRALLRDLPRAVPGGTSQPMGLVGRMTRKISRKLRRRQQAAPANNHTRYFDAVLKAIETGNALPVSPEEARVSLELCIAIYSSGITGQPVRLPLDGTAPFYRGVTAADYAERVTGDRRTRIGGGDDFPSGTARRDASDPCAVSASNATCAESGS